MLDYVVDVYLMSTGEPSGFVVETFMVKLPFLDCRVAPTLSQVESKLDLYVHDASVIMMESHVVPKAPRLELPHDASDLE